MERFETRFKHIDVLPMVKHFMGDLDMFSLFTQYVPVASIQASQLRTMGPEYVCHSIWKELG